MRFEHVLNRVGSGGKWQLYVTLLISINGIFVTLYNLSSVFLLATPDHWCAIPGANARPLGPNWTLARVRQFAVPGNDPNCEIYVRNYMEALAAPWTEGLDEYEDYDASQQPQTRRCDLWTYDQSTFQSTAVTTWDLVCDDKFYASVAKSAYLVGILFGSLIGGFISDSYGRRKAATFATVLYVVAGLSSAMRLSYWLFVALRVFIGIGCAISSSSYYMLLAEVMDPGIRGVVQMAYLGVFAIGMMILPGMAYLINDWAYLTLAISLPSIVCIAFYCLIPESPRWLILKGRLEDAYTVLRSIAKTNGKEIERDELLDMISDCHRTEIISNDTLEKRATLCLISDLFRKEMRKTTLTSYCLWGIATSSYYAIIFHSPSLGGNIFFTIFLSGATEFPSYILGAILVKLVRRRMLTAATFISGGILSMAYLLVPHDIPWTITSVAFASKFLISIAYCTLSIIIVELFPTRHRHIALGTSSTCGRIGAIMAPFVVDIMNANGQGASVMGIYGIQCLLAGLLCLSLPETKTKMLPETIEDVKHFEQLEMNPKSVP